MPSPEFQGIVSCVPTFEDPACTTKVVELCFSAALLSLGVILTTYLLRNFTLREKIYMKSSLLFLSGYLLINIFYCLWHNFYELYSVETYFNNLYFLSIVMYTVRSYLIKRPLKVRRHSGDNSEQTVSHQKNLIRNLRIYKIIYRSMVTVFFCLFTLIFITSLVGDTENNSDDSEPQADGDNLFSFLKDSCEELWYLVVNIVSVVLSVIVMVVLYKNHQLETKRLKELTLNYQSQPEEPKATRVYKANTRNPLRKLWIWMGLNILAEVVDVVESGLLINADPKNECMIIPQSQSSNNILRLFFVVMTVYLQYSVTLWFFYDSVKNYQRERESNENLLAHYQYSEEIRVGNIELNLPSLYSRSSRNSEIY